MGRVRARVRGRFRACTSGVPTARVRVAFYRVGRPGGRRRARAGKYTTSATFTLPCGQWPV